MDARGRRAGSRGPTEGTPGRRAASTSAPRVAPPPPAGLGRRSRRGKAGRGPRGEGGPGDLPGEKAGRGTPGGRRRAGGTSRGGPGDPNGGEGGPGDPSRGMWAREEGRGSPVGEMGWDTPLEEEVVCGTCQPAIPTRILDSPDSQPPEEDRTQGSQECAGTGSSVEVLPALEPKRSPAWPAAHPQQMTLDHSSAVPATGP
ncbi:putative polyketide hydroxylase [Mustela lutreola]|uniref:putative polyketide hydroxylase n=1 Tax=Mustela lutreola TaxID=9666 RepID=UPI002797181C|nr:putative polyketide hydroxylase [Mustela lutreola]